MKINNSYLLCEPQPVNKIKNFWMWVRLHFCVCGTSDWCLDISIRIHSYNFIPGRGRVSPKVGFGECFFHFFLLRALCRSDNLRLSVYFTSQTGLWVRWHGRWRVATKYAAVFETQTLHYHYGPSALPWLPSWESGGRPSVTCCCRCGDSECEVAVVTLHETIIT